MKSIILTLACAACVFCLSAAAHAATLSVGSGQTYTTIGAALAAANTDDLIRITDSGTYNESLTINKRVAIVANVGFSPVIRGDGVTTHVLRTADGCGGAQIGAYGTGQIILDPAASAVVVGVIVPGHTDVTPVVYENIVIQNLAAATNQINPHSSGANTFRYVEATGGAQMLKLSDAAVVNAQYRFERCRMRGMTFTGSIRMTDGSVNMVSEYCEFVTGGTAAAFWYVTNDNPGTFTWNHCIIREDVAGLTCMLTDSVNIVMNYSYCTILSYRHCIQVFNPASAYTLNMDHCDLYGDYDGADPANTGSRRAPTILLNDAAGRSVSITNTNILSNSTQFGWTESDVDAGNDVLRVSNYNNYEAPPNVNVVLGANDITSPSAVLPDYVDVVAGNFAYTTPSLISAGAGGTPIGSMLTASAVPVELSTFEVR